MADAVMYKQCQLKHPSTGQLDVAWIPSQYAKKGKWLRIGETDGWLVDEVYAGTTLSAEEMVTRRERLKRFQYVLGD